MVCREGVVASAVSFRLGLYARRWEQEGSWGVGDWETIDG